MLKFDRKEFRSGTIIVREVVKTGAKDKYGAEIVVFKEHRFSVHDKGKLFEFADEDAILSKYSHLFTRA